jgi:cellulose synthase/poly-beta-1,6-N-acetylglucosamine synthase-like glycosyltransferase
MSKRSPLEDPETALALWRRFRRLMAWMFLTTVTVVIGTMTMLYREVGMVSIHFYIAIAIGLSFAMLLMAGLMGLVFLSNASGHDASVDDREE